MKIYFNKLNKSCNDEKIDQSEETPKVICTVNHRILFVFFPVALDGFLKIFLNTKRFHGKKFVLKKINE